MMISSTEELNTALKNAQNGDTLRLANAHFSGPFVIKTAGLTICSADADNPATIEDSRPNSPPNENFTVSINAGCVTLQNLNFKTPNCIAIRINEAFCSLQNLTFKYVKIAFICSAQQLNFKNIKIRHFTEDGIRLSSDGFVGKNILIEDLYARDTEAHHDGIQLYAGKPNTTLRHAGRYEGKYALNKGSLKNVIIRSTTEINRDSIGKLQGIFASDGFMDGIQLEDIQVVTHDCIHGVSLRGIRTATDNTRSVFKNVTVKQTPGISGHPAQIRLIPARRLTPEGMTKYGQTASRSILSSSLNVITLEKDESNISDILFPPQSFRSDDSSSESKVQSRSISTPDWECIPQGAFDTVQEREVNYQIKLEDNHANTVEDFSCDKNPAPITPPTSESNNNQMISNSLDRGLFYNSIRDKPFKGRLMQSQVEGIETFLDEWDKRGLDDIRYLAYILATAFHETAHTMQPIAEYGKGRGRRYGSAESKTGKIYYGRGFVQITWKKNYKRFAKLLDIDLVNHPEKALETKIATTIIFDGMLKGMFTGKKLSHYFREESDWFNARKIVNGLDKAELIGRYGRQFWYALLIASGELDDLGTRSLEPFDEESDEIDDEPFSEILELQKEFG